eukprot:3635883-Rhodomonas_salina.1
MAGADTDDATTSRACRAKMATRCLAFLCTRCACRELTDSIVRPGGAAVVQAASLPDTPQ